MYIEPRCTVNYTEFTSAMAYVIGPVARRAMYKCTRKPANLTHTVHPRLYFEPVQDRRGGERLQLYSSAPLCM